MNGNNTVSGLILRLEEVELLTQGRGWRQSLIDHPGKCTNKASLISASINPQNMAETGCWEPSHSLQEGCGEGPSVHDVQHASGQKRGFKGW